MSEALKTAKLYFTLSNKSDFAGIAKLLTESTTYSSEATGVYLGGDNIVSMQKAFHAAFVNPKWTIRSIDEVKPGIIKIEYAFNCTKINGQSIETIGIEYVIVYQDKIQHLEVRNINKSERS